MHVFQIRGFSGILMLVAAAISAILLLLLLPASFMMVLWNASVFESFQGPQINLYQGFCLWGFVMVLLKMVFKPEIKLQFQTSKDGKAQPLAKTDASTEESETSTATVVVDEPADQK